MSGYKFESADDYNAACNGDHEDFHMEDEGSFEQDGDMQFRSIITKHIERQKFYELFETRSGSPWTDWNYDDPYDLEALEVHKVDVTVQEWRNV